MTGGRANSLLRRVAVTGSLVLIALYGVAWIYAEMSGMGATAGGRDLSTRLLAGNRAVFRVSLLAAGFVMPLGVGLGVAAAARGGRLRRAVFWLCDVLSAVPGLLIMITVALLAGGGVSGAVLAICLAAFATFCRETHEAVRREWEQPYVLAATGLGLPPGRILFGHVLPAALPAVAVAALMFLQFAASSEVILGFLGLGVEQGASWGGLLREARVPLWQGAWQEMTSAALAIFFLLLPLNLLAAMLAPNGRDAQDGVGHGVIHG